MEPRYGISLAFTASGENGRTGKESRRPGLLPTSGSCGLSATVPPTRPHGRTGGVAGQKRRDHVEHRVTEAAHVQDIVAVRRLRCRTSLRAPNPAENERRDWRDCRRSVRVSLHERSRLDSHVPSYSSDRRKGDNVPLSWLYSRRFLGVEDTEDAPWGTVETADFLPIHSAARMRDVATVLKELESGVEVDLVGERAKNGDGGNTALWYAAQGPWPGGIEVAKVLVDAGAEVNRQCEHGRTALHMAAAWGHLDLVKFLLEKSADPSIRDEENMTPAMVARYGYSSNRVTHDERQDVLLYFDSLGLE